MELNFLGVDIWLIRIAAYTTVCSLIVWLSVMGKCVLSLAEYLEVIYVCIYYLFWWTALFFVVDIDIKSGGLSNIQSELEKA